MMRRPAKHSFSIRGHRTSISLEPEFWDALAEIARARAISLSALVAEIDSARTGDAGLSIAVRLYVLGYYREQARATITPPL
ncbi:MAG: ribbon-helix-helix domain-containing protein [Hyphomicrobiaceae bacterium]|nr:ribbon-helix-helix domain-containing protein [Hyphomicrobiaceae bacterium]